MRGRYELGRDDHPANAHSYQATAFAEVYTTLGYLAAIMGMLTLAFQPRAKFLQAMFFSLFFTCLGAAVALLQIQCAVAARQLGNPPQQSATGTSGSKEAIAYSPSASAVAAVWLFFTIYVANLVKAYRPQLMICIIQYSIFTIISSIYAPNFPNMAAGMSFVRRLLTTFLTGFAFGTGVNLLIFPMTSRGIVEKQIAGMLGLMKGSLMAQGQYMAAIGDAQRLANGKDGKDGTDPAGVNAKAKALKGNTTALGGIFAKIKMEITFAKKEIGYGKIGPEEYSEILLRLQQILLPIIGMSTFMDIMQSVKKRNEKLGQMIDSEETLEAIRSLQTEEWDEVISLSREPFAKLKAAFAGGLTHFSYMLGVASKPKPKEGDVENDAGGTTQPGDKEYAQFLKAAIDEFHTHRQTAIIRWCERKGIDLPASHWDNPEVHFSLKDHFKNTESVRKVHNQQQLYLILYIEYLIFLIGTSILKAVNYADAKYADGTFAKNRFIFPGFRRLQKLISETLTNRDSVNDMTDGDNTGTNIWIGDSLKTRKDPEHLPPANVYQKVTNHFRGFSALLASPQSSFAFRAATATISIGILAFIHETQHFFLNQRGVWAMIMIGISMDSHTGRGIFGFIFRILGTAIAMIASMVIWYIGYRHAAAIIPVFYIYMVGCLWFLLKNPQFAIAAIISIVTAILILGYELQGEKIGRKALTSNGQEYYPLYILGPYRLASVVVGLAIAFIWTYFPYPVTTHSTLRKDLGSTMYLMANYYSCTHTTINARLSYGTLASENQKGTPMWKLAKARRKVFGKMIVMISKLREHSNFTKWEPTFGGKFPKETYDELINSLQHMFNYASLMAFSSAAFTTDDDPLGRNGGGKDGDGGDEGSSEWLKDFRKFTADLRPTSHDVTSTLCLLSASLTNSQPLPPYMKKPKPFDLANRMEKVDPEILSIQHITEPCYAAFAVLEVASSLITEEMQRVSELVTGLVGEVDFSFHVVSTMAGGYGGGGGDSEVQTLVGEDEKKGKRD